MNFVSITFDDLNAFAFLKALYGSQLHTPNIDRVMAMGTTFDNAFAQVAICNASRTSVLSGLDPAATGVHANFEIWHEFVDPAGTLPALLKDAGYSTSIIGKVFHQSDMPEHVASVVADYIFRAPGDSYEDSTVITTRPSTGWAEAQGDYINVDHAIDIVNAAGGRTRSRCSSASSNRTSAGSFPRNISISIRSTRSSFPSRWMATFPTSRNS